MFSMQAKSATSPMDNAGNNKQLPVKFEPANGPSPPFAAGMPFFPPLLTHHNPSPLGPSPLQQQQFFQREMGSSAPVGSAALLGQSSRPTGPFPSQMLLQLVAANQQHFQQQQQKLWEAASATANLSGASCSTNSSASSSSASNQQPLPSLLNNNGGFESSGATPFHHPPSIASANFPGAFQLQHNLLPFLQQQMQQQQLVNPSPKQEQKPKLQQSSSIAGIDPMAQQQQQQLWLQAFAMALGAMQQQQQQNGSEENGKTGDHDSIGNGGVPPLTADKRLKRDSNGNALCPACHLPIGKDTAQWAKHLEFERAKLQKTYQSLKEKALFGFSKTVESSTTAPAGQQQQQTDGSAEDEENEKRRNQRQRDSVLERIRANQRRRIDAKLRGQFFTASLSLAHNIVLDEQNHQQRGRSNGPSPQSTTAKGDDYLHVNGTKTENGKEQKLHHHNHNGHPAAAATSVKPPPNAPLQNGNSQPLLMTTSTRKRVSPPSFSALELAEPSSSVPLATADGRNSEEDDTCESEQFLQKRPKLEAGDLC